MSKYVSDNSFLSNIIGPLLKKRLTNIFQSDHLTVKQLEQIQEIMIQF
jgi:uncharacterized protein YqkB